MRKSYVREGCRGNIGGRRRAYPVIAERGHRVIRIAQVIPTKTILLDHPFEQTIRIIVDERREKYGRNIHFFGLGVGDSLVYKIIGVAGR